MMKIDINNINLLFAFGEKEDYYFAHVIEPSGNISLEMKFSKDIYVRPFAYRLAIQVYKDIIS